VDQDSTFSSCHPTHLIHTSHSPQYPNHQDIAWSSLWRFLSWFVHKTYMVTMVPVFRALLLALSRNSWVWVHSQIRKVVTLSWTSELSQPGSRMHIPREELRPLSWMECKILDWTSKLLEWKTLQCWKQTYERQKILTRQFLLIKWMQVCSYSSWVDMWAQNGWQWLILIFPVQLYLPLTWDLSRSKGHSLSQLARRLRGWVRAHNLAGNFHRQQDYTRIQKKQEPFK
jgi:hypothetical protein